MKSVAAFKYLSDQGEREACLELAASQEIDSSKYSLHDFNHAEYLDGMKLSERARMIYSFAEDCRQRSQYQYERTSLTGSTPTMRLIDARGVQREGVINLASNDYLNLTQHPRVKRATIDATTKYGAGAGSVPLLAGTLDIHRELCRKIAKFKTCEDAILFSSGFATNYGVLSTLLRKRDVAIIDMYAHASLFEGVKDTNRLVFKHNDLSSLERKLRMARDQYVNKIVVVDGVYSMDGDICPLDRIVDLAHEHGALVLVDDAHATGVIGQHGRGTPEHHHVQGRVDIVCGTLSKAIGAVGGFAAASKEVIQLLKMLSRPFFFSTALPPGVAGAALAAFDVIETEPQLRDKLWRNIGLLKSGLACLPFNLSTAETAIFPLIIGDDGLVKDLCARLHEDNIYANPVPYPAVARKLARVRLSVTSGIEENQIDYVVDRLSAHCRALGIQRTTAASRREETAVAT